jgi:hypothetical protein
VYWETYRPDSQKRGFHETVGVWRVSKHRIGIVLWAVSLLSIFWIASAQAQTQGGGWSEPYRLSSDAGKASEGYLVADQYGYVHLFWSESLFDNHMRVIKYARFNGGTWTNPNDIYIANAGITNISPFVDQHGTLHIAWSEGLTGPAYYTRAPANDAVSAQNWMKPIQIDIPARTLHLRVDTKGVFHLLYVNQADIPGINYIRSVDQGITWSAPVWLDPDILPYQIPDSLNFELDDNGGLHAVWVYGTLDQKYRPDRVRYTHSLDGGNTWLQPITMDQVDEETDHYLTTAGPVMILQGKTVHILWAAGNLPYRYHRYSTDAGQTWSVPKQVFGELHGQAFDGLAVDRAGRVHFFAQIRYPQGVYHAYWENNQWTPASLVYLIAQEGEQIGDRIHAHHTHPIVRAGNQLVLTFADGPADPNRRLFAMQRTLDDLSPLEPVPTPMPTATSLTQPSPTPGQPTPLPTLMEATPAFINVAAQPAGNHPKPDQAIWIALISNLLLFGGFVAIRMVHKRKH